MKQKLTYIHTLSDLYTLLGSVILSLCISLSLNDFFSLSNSPVFFILFTFLFIFLFRFIADNHNKIMAYFILYKCQVKIPHFCAVKIPHFYSILIYP